MSVGPVICVNQQCDSDRIQLYRNAVEISVVAVVKLYQTAVWKGIAHKHVLEADKARGLLQVL